MAEPDPPPGFERHFRRSPLTEPWEPLYSLRDGEQFSLGLRVAEPHCNARGLAHGGLISALADNAMGIASVLASKGGAAGATTVSLTVDFVGPARLGRWLQVTAEPIKQGRTLAFAQGLVTADGEIVARASAVFRMQENDSEVGS